MVTGIYGGSFNPIHLGHTALGQWLVEKEYVEELWLLVSPQNPLKQGATLLDDAARLHLAQLAVAATNEPRLKVSDFEFQLPKPSFMVHTLAALREAYPEREFVLVVGADNWQHFQEWYQPEEILKHHRVLVFPRKGYEAISTVPSPLYELSATDIRQQIAHGISYQGEGLHPAVWQEIQARGYYR